MKCPKCGEEMILKKNDNSFNFDVKPKKEYEKNMTGVFTGARKTTFG